MERAEDKTSRLEYLIICFVYGALLLFLLFSIYKAATEKPTATIHCSECRVMDGGLIAPTTRCERWEDGKTRSDLKLDAD